MVDDFKSIRENLFKVLTGIGAGAPGTGEDDEDADDDSGVRIRGLDAGAARALIGALFARAGKGKDEVVQIIAREIGVAVAAMLKEPLSQLARHQKLQISFEFVPKEGHEKALAKEEAERDRAAAASRAAADRKRHGAKRGARPGKSGRGG
jgi:hypothetical protein